MNANSTSLRYAVDIVFCIDVTGSMYPALDQVQEGALTFHKRLEESLAARGRALSDLRLRVVAYRDFRDNPADALQQSPFYAVPEQVGEFESFVRRLIAGGGGDEPESGLEALAVAFGSDWAGGPDRRHIVALLTDASAHPLGVGRGASTYPPGVPVTLDDLRAPLADATKRLLLFAPGTTPWNVIAADWDHVVHRPARVGGGLIEYEFTEIIDAIGSSI